jgi:hypothetical protein
MSWITLRACSRPLLLHFTIFTAADFRTLVLVAVRELEQIAIERGAKVDFSAPKLLAKPRRASPSPKDWRLGC